MFESADEFSSSNIDMKQIDGTDIARWAETLDARSSLPELVRRLITATVKLDQTSRIDFPSGEGIQKFGYDGILDVVSGNAWVPIGCSVWEMGADKNISTKANDDYSKRTDNSLGIDKANTAYVLSSGAWSCFAHDIQGCNKMQINQKADTKLVERTQELMVMEGK